jgi:CotH kinase protein
MQRAYRECRVANCALTELPGSVPELFEFIPTEIVPMKLSNSRIVCFLLIVATSILHCRADETDSKISAKPAINSDALFSSDRVAKIEIQIEPKLWDKMRLQKREFVDALIDPNNSPFEYVEGNVRIDGVEVSKVGVRKKGFLGSLDDDYPSMIIKLDEYVDQAPLGPVKRLTLNNNKQDGPLLSAYMSYRLFNQAGVPAPRVGFATVFVNDKHLGVYSLVESIDKNFLKRNFGDNSGDLLEGTLADFSTQSIQRMDLKSGKHKLPAEWRVNEIAKLLAEKELDLEKLETLIDTKAFFKFWATESLLAFWDGYSANQNNFFVYEDSKTSRMHFIPWGADSLWSSMAGPFGGFSKQNDAVYANAALCHAIFKTEAGRERYLGALRELLDQQWKESELNATIDEMAELLKPHQHSRQNGAAQSQKDMKRFIKNRRERVEKELANWPVKIADAPRKPMHSEVVGSVSGEFNTYWQRPPKGEKSNIVLSVKIGDDVIEFVEPRVAAKRFSMGFMNFGAPAESMPPIIEVSGSSSKGERYVLTISFDVRDFNDVSESKTVKVRGSLNKVERGGSGGWPMGPNMRYLQGECELQKASITPGEPVVGKFDAKVLRLVGGFFGG